MFEKCEMKEAFEVSFSPREKFLNGINKLCDAVKTTLGPNGKNVLIKKNVESFFTKDGVTVARNVYFTDVYENIGAEKCKEASIRTNEMAGDGTTTSAVLAQKFINEGFKMIDGGMKPLDLEKEINRDVAIVIENLKKSAKQIATPEEVINIATIAANDKETGALIGGIYNEIGKDGLIITEDSKTIVTSHEIIDGIRFDKGFVSPYFITDIQKEKAVVDDAYILITDLDILYFTNLVPIVDKITLAQGKNIVVIGNKITGEALMGMAENKVLGRFHFLGIEAPNVDRKEFLEDLALITGGKYISAEMNFQLVNLELSDLGRAKKVICEKNSTIVVDGKGDKELLAQKIAFLKENEEANKYRLKRFNSKIAVLKVGAKTESELLTKKYNFEDSVEATKSALEEGIVVGGGVALINASNDLTGSIVKTVCQEPFMQLMKNIDLDGKKLIKDIKDNVGYNAYTEELVDLWQAGIIDALKVVRVALENAASIACLILKTEAIVLNIKQLEKFNDHALEMNKYD